MDPEKANPAPASNPEGEIEELLKENLEISKENNELLKQMRRTARFSLIFSVLKWVIIIGSALGVYYYFGQTFSDLIDTYKDLLGQGTAETASSASAKIDSLRGRLDNLKGMLR